MLISIIPNKCRYHNYKHTINDYSNLYNYNKKPYFSQLRVSF